MREGGRVRFVKFSNVDDSNQKLRLKFQTYLEGERVVGGGAEARDAVVRQVESG